MPVTPRYGRERYGGVVYQGTWSSVYPAPPAPVFNAPVANAAGIYLSWTATGSVMFTLQRSTDNVTFTTIVSGLLSPSYLDTSVIPGGNTYYYRLTGYGPQNAASPVASQTATSLTKDVPGIQYFYENVGLYLVSSPNGIQWAYENVGLPPTFWPIIGRVRVALNDTYGTLSLYENVT